MSSNQAAVQSVEALKELRVALALFSDEALEALGAVEVEVRRTLQWLQHDRRLYWQDQIKRRRERVAAAQAELFRRQLVKLSNSSPSCIEQKEQVRKAEASLQEAERCALMVKKWEPALQQAVFEYHGSIRRIKTLAGDDVPRAMARLERMIEAVEAYLRVPVPTGRGGDQVSPLESIGNAILDDEPAVAASAEVDANANVETGAEAEASAEPPEDADAGGSASA